jgi:alkylation response protein AidB-like acyl-CoA dehydrogenase
MSSGAVLFDGLDAEHAALAAVAADLLANSADADAAIAGSGWAGIGIGEDLGGSGGTFSDLAPIVEAMGAHLSSSSLPWSTGVIAPALLGGDAPPGPLLSAIASGECPAAIPVGSPWAAASAIQTDGHSGQARLSGSVRTIGPAVGVIALQLLADGTETIAIVPASHPAVSVCSRSSVDRSRPVSDVVLRDFPLADAIAVAGYDGAFATWLRHAGVMCALDAVGGARVAMARLLDYAVARYQFGRAIGSFQAYKHRCARAFIELKLAQSLAFRAAARMDEPDGACLALSAAVFSANRAAFVVGEAIQLHGAIGFTWELGLHAYLKRAKVDEIIGVADGAAARELLKEEQRSGSFEPQPG